MPKILGLKKQILEEELEMELLAFLLDQKVILGLAIMVVIMLTGGNTTLLQILGHRKQTLQEQQELGLLHLL